MDQHAKSRADAQLLGDQLGDLLTDINDNSVESEFKVACALASLNISSVVTVLNEYSGDNHGDTNLVDETVQTIRTLNTLNTYWDLVKSYGLEDRMLFTTLNVFGRTAGTNDRGGRDHDGSFTVGMIQGAGVNGGVYGDLVAGTRNKKPVEVSGISLANGDQVSANETLSAYGKTIMTLAGCSEARVNARIPTSQVISDIIAT